MITSPDYTGAVLVLVHADTGAPVAVGDTVVDFRGNAMTITGGRAPHHEASTGRVYTDGGEYFPGVANLAWRPLASIVGGAE